MKNSVCVLLNLRLNDLTKVNRFLKLIEILASSQAFEYSIRLRGIYEEKAIGAAHEILTKHQARFVLYPGNTVPNWKLNTLAQVKESSAISFFLLNEDHLPVVPIDKLVEYFDYCHSNKVDIGLLVFPESYQKMYEYLTPQFAEHEIFIVREMTYKTWKSIPAEVKNYPVSLVGFYNKEYLEKILSSRRPVLRRYPFNSPFDFEQSGSKKWLFPFQIAFSKTNILGCIDDDGGQPGTSLISKGLYTEDSILRSPEHHKEVFGEKFIRASLSPSRHRRNLLIDFLYIFQRKAFNLIRLGKYSLHGIVCWDLQKVILRRRRSSNQEFNNKNN
jgi:hypothetical protein